MHKFTLFTVILSIITVSIVIDIIINGYSLPENYIPTAERSETVAPSPIRVATTAQPPGEAIPTQIAPAVTSPDEAIQEVLSPAIALPFDTASDLITPAFLAELGLKQGTVRPATNKPLYLQALTLDEKMQKTLKVVNIFDFEEYLGTIYALRFETAKEAMSAYSELKTMALALPRTNIKETNTFGDASFYLNQEGKTKTAFSTARIGSHVYGLEYPHKSHQFFKNISEKLKVALTPNS